MRLSLFPFVASILIACGPGSPASAQTAVPRYPAEAFAALPGVVQPKLSPGGGRLATRISKDGATYLMILSIDGSAPALISTRGSDLNWWKWVNDDWLVVGIGDKRPFADSEAYVTRALGVSADGKTVNPLLDRVRDMGQQGDDVIWTAHDGSPRILVSVQRSIYSDDVKFWPQVYEVNVATGRFDLKVDSHEGVFHWVADANGTSGSGLGRTAPATRTAFSIAPPAKPISEVIRARMAPARTPNIPASYSLTAAALRSPTTPAAFPPSTNMIWRRCSPDG